MTPWRSTTSTTRSPCAFAAWKGPMDSAAATTASASLLTRFIVRRGRAPRCGVVPAGRAILSPTLPMSGSRRHFSPSTGMRGAFQVADGAFRGLLLGAVVAIGSVLFAAALLPPFGAAGRAVERFARQFDQIGADVDLTFPQIPERSTIYAADGSVLATLYLDENRDYVHLKRINDITRKAVLAIEDSRFYEHPGLDIKGIVRALVTNLQAGEIEEGASTLTQQLARNVFPKAIGTEQTLARKILEARVAVRLEDQYS